MTKKAALKSVSLARPARALSPIHHRGAALSLESISPFADRLLTDVGLNAGSSNDALTFLVENIVDNLGEGGEEQTQMRDFLNLLLDTDPTLRDEILAGVSERK
jgi:hypothetical protein